MSSPSISEIQQLRSPLAVVYASAMESTGVSILVAVSFLSLLAVFGLLVAIGVSAVNSRKVEGQALFIHSHVSAYFICLLICWILQCLGTALSIQWLQDRMIVIGQFCTAQAALKHIADVGIAVWTLVIAGHTFCVLFLELRIANYVLWLALGLGWTVIFFLVGSGPLFIARKEIIPFYGIDGRWCWISPVYTFSQVFLAWVPILLAVALSMVLYTLTFFRLRGNIVRNGWKLAFRRMDGDESGKYFDNDQTMVAAKQMLLYPVTYAILATPIVIVQFVSWSGIKVSFEWVVFSGSVYLLSGLLNAIVFTTTRRILPASSLRLGNWYFIPRSRENSTTYGAYSADRAEKGISKTVKFAAEPTILCTPPGRRESGKRPPALSLSPGHRDSMASMYSAREGVYMGAPLSSHWSPDTPPLNKASRLSVYLENVSAIAQKI
ncbi:hypothetical protein CC1G_02043 [Coprinopsis cinerea okayama7|uniref:Glucose receptor Git3 N-terminal domain-containing protein n=1 Tax=Coprinopsis cinerea (strain Okayama-7 / 130 / ATCC MYA-4618 / FGSC 9003) TaxID=240176 RepID=A8N6D8_COPC7|nr:hypothetical protein CC1G_02043 [Coprinopsis cinerea okayama7\|eukprot:XP_001830407.2 hypothetical protein CC1G_02043 [Coprinopsis cinerea okayama7\